jgi:hypothetical protein
MQWTVALLEPKSATIYDAGFTMIDMIPNYMLTVWSFYVMCDANYVRQMCAYSLIQLYYNQKLN